MTSTPTPTELDSLVAQLRDRGITKVRSFAWRDRDDPDAGGSEIHADEIFSRWVDAGLAVEHRTSALVSGTIQGRGYDSVQAGGRYDVFARVIAREIVRRQPADTAIVEIWNGVPWFSPMWRSRAGVVWMHHVHGKMWDEAIRKPFNILGQGLEAKIAPRFYRKASIVTLSDSSRREIEAIGIPPSSITVVPPGVSARFQPDEPSRSPSPHVVIVGRLAPVKRMPQVVRSLAAVRSRIGELTVEIVGEGVVRAELQDWITANDAAGWVTLRGRISDEELVRAYQRAWLVVSGSHAEGWGMSLTEGAACGCPSVATDIAGHRGAVDPGISGMLVEGVEAIGAAVADLLANPRLVDKLRQGAISHAANFSWDRVAAAHLGLLLASVRR